MWSLRWKAKTGRCLQVFLVCVLNALTTGCQEGLVETGWPTAETKQSVESESSEKAPGKSSESPATLSHPLKDMVRIPAGPFLFGASEQHFRFFLSLSVFNYPGMVENMRKLFVMPSRQVRTPEYLIDRFEVTNEHYQYFLGKTGYQPNSTADFLKHWEKTRSPPEWSLTFPVVWVNQEDAQTFCEWRGGRLPTEEEWEKAARGTGEDRYFPWGNRMPQPTTANFGTKQAEPSGNRTDDVSPFEVYDMGGNVSELTLTRVTKGSNYKVIAKGGAFSAAARDMLTFYRMLIPRSSRQATVGFRCAVETGSASEQQ